MKVPLFFLYDYVFPNFILPNATPPEMGIINYIHSMYSNKLKTESFFDINLETPQSNMKLIFDESLGTWPVSVQHNGSYFKNSGFRSLVEIYEDSVYHGKNIKGYKKYIYSIKVTPHFTNFTGTDWAGRKLNGEFFWKNISDEVLHDVRNGDATILLEWCNESILDKSDFEALHYSLKYSGIPKNQIILVMNGINSQQVYESWFSESERALLVKSIPFLAYDISWYYSNNKSYRLTEEQFFTSKNVERKYHFVFPNRRAREYRVSLLLKMHENQLLEKGNWSLLSNINVNMVGNKFQEFLSKLPHNLEEEQGTTFSEVYGNQDKSSAWNLSSYFYIASETFMYNDYKAFTEKVFKPLVNFQPFVFASFSGALQELRNMGFKTFHPFIDESYDLEPNNDVRLAMIYKEIEKLCSMDKNQIHEWYWSMEDILLYNHQHAINLHKEKSTKNNLLFFTDLANRCI